MSVITLNVGGKKFVTSKETLLCEKGTYFEGLFNFLSHSENVDNATDNNNEYFIDRDPKNFSIILNHLRGYHIGSILSNLTEEEKSLLSQDIKFYNIHSLFQYFPLLLETEKVLIGYSDKFTIRTLFNGRTLGTIKLSNEEKENGYRFNSFVKIGNLYLATGDKKGVIRIYDFTTGALVVQSNLLQTVDACITNMFVLDSDFAEEIYETLENYDFILMESFLVTIFDYKTIIIWRFLVLENGKTILSFVKNYGNLELILENKNIFENNFKEFTKDILKLKQNFSIKLKDGSLFIGYQQQENIYYYQIYKNSDQVYAKKLLQNNNSNSPSFKISNFSPNPITTSFFISSSMRTDLIYISFKKPNYLIAIFKSYNPKVTICIYDLNNNFELLNQYEYFRQEIKSDPLIDWNINNDSSLLSTTEINTTMPSEERMKSIIIDGSNLTGYDLYYSNGDNTNKSTLEVNLSKTGTPIYLEFL
ncbi:hypothetical protein ABK040_005240 [Willaertia magna]